MLQVSVPIGVDSSFQSFILKDISCSHLLLEEDRFHSFQILTHGGLELLIDGHISVLQGLF